MSYAERVAVAVNNENWQRVRRSMKGISTADKLRTLEEYYNDNVTHDVSDAEIELVKIRIDNYIKALCRGGQLEAGMTFDHFNDGCIWDHIRK